MAAAGKLPLREVMVRPATFAKYQERIQRATAATLAEMSSARAEKRPPPMKQREAAAFLSKLTGERWTPQRIVGTERAFSRPSELTERREIGQMFERPEFGGVQAWSEKGVQFYQPGNASAPVPLEYRKTFFSKDDVHNYFDRTGSKKALTVVVRHDKYGNEVYDVYLAYTEGDSDSENDAGPSIDE